MRYEDTLSADQEEIEKTFWCKWDKSVYLKGETTMIYIYMIEELCLGRMSIYI